MTDLPKSIGWVGLGSMGYPMATNLLHKTGDEMHLYVYDVVQESIDKFVHDGKGRAHACSSSKEVADEAV
ncbi:NAD binding 2-domain-containing protein [Teratosphaeria destructans]|uniref:3-hydroxyisobutyrate dehydrogenase n=1 Tax=Teratosphaeria destructans TaxID=418781 RepID=A0A9W7SJF7_9PEZI|nr:NAD binding 2-domain-containing protein [Teratosphaeria destructans]